MNIDELGPLNLGTILIQLMFMAFTALVLVGIFTRKADDPREVTSWARGHGIVLTARNRPLVTWFVRLNLVLRVVGGVFGWLIGSLFDAALRLHTSGGVGFWVWVIVGWLAGSAWAERSLARPAEVTGTASLLPRRVGDYLPIGLQIAPLAAAALLALVATVGTQLRWPAHPQFRPPTDAKLIALSVCGLGIATAVVMVLRSVVARRQPYMPADLTAADDAIRASTAHHLAGGGTAAVLLLAAHVIHAITGPFHLRFGVRGWGPLAPILAAYFAWRYFAYRGWLVRRAAGTANPASTVLSRQQGERGPVAFQNGPDGRSGDQ